MPYFSGRVNAIVFDNAAQGFYILRMMLDTPSGGGGVLDLDLNQGRTDNVVVRGDVTGLPIKVGTWFGFEGAWVTHEQYGMQILISRAPVVEAWTPDVACSVLMSNGVGSRVVGLLKEHLGAEMVTVLDTYDVGKLVPVPDLTPEQREHVVERWRVAKAYFRTLEFLAGAGIPRNRVAQVWSTFREKAEEVLTTNPWALVKIDGITFAQADEVSNRLGLSKDSPFRIEGAVHYAVKARKGMGHLYMTTGEIVAEVDAMMACSVPRDLVAQAIMALHKAKGIVVDRTARPGVTAIYEPWLHKVESVSATALMTRVETAHMDTDPAMRDQYVSALARTGPQAEAAFEQTPGDARAVAHAAIMDWSGASRITLSPKQVTGAVYALTEPVSVITGLPGTGKTMLLRVVVRMLKDAGVSFLLIAPTGIAAKRMATMTGAPASTIHRAFGAKGWDKGASARDATYAGVSETSTSSAGVLEGSDGSGESWKCSDSPYHADVVILDETSMCDQHLLYRILTCTKPSTRLVFIGDAAQLPSVGPGNVLRDMVSSQLFPNVALTEIFRQADTSQIVVAAHAIHAGNVPEASGEVDGEFVLLYAKSEDAALDKIVHLAHDLYQKKINFQVMSPRHAGPAGVTSLNTRLRELLNPKQPGLAEMRIGSETVREGDRVMVVKNNYEVEVFNGDVGKVRQLDRKGKEVEIKVHGPPIQHVRFTSAEAAEYLRLAYAVTVHKMQGSEADVVLIPLLKSFSHQLQRNLLYTAITRARLRVILVGQYDALVQAVENANPDARHTLFLDRLLTASKNPAKSG